VVTGVIFALAIAVAAGLTASSARADCRTAFDPFRAAVEAADVAQANARIALVEKHCPLKIGVAARAGLGQLHARWTRAEREAGGAIDSLAFRLRDWARLSSHWEVERELALLAEALGDYAEAAIHYTRALELIDDPARTPTKPNDSVIYDLHAKTGEALALSDEIIEGATRNGGLSAYHRRSVRGVAVPVKRPQITFHTGTVKLTDRGESGLEELTRILANLGSDLILVVGHADERGGEEYNLKLSGSRMRAIANFLHERGVAVAGVYACGEWVPPNVTDPDRFSQEQLWRIARRVEVYYSAADVDPEIFERCVDASRGLE
jgi:outer membrane protein OmpA-like peptidoglycan-associated protein